MMGEEIPVRPEALVFWKVELRLRFLEEALEFSGNSIVRDQKAMVVADGYEVAVKEPVHSG
jgi:hypothetical protein